MLHELFTASVLLVFARADFAERPATSNRGMCPGGIVPLAIDCDPKHPWPRCPSQTYCFATDSVDLGPYYCCPNPPTDSDNLNKEPAPNLARTSPTTPQNPQLPPSNSLQAIPQTFPFNFLRPNPQTLPFNSLQSKPQTNIAQLVQRNVISEEQLRRISEAIAQWLKSQGNVNFVNQYK
uniref:Secreted protein n=1 Tax=Haemonchus contortus TaxID=6289 RepID=A0A7I4Y5A7_HAECO